MLRGMKWFHSLSLIALVLVACNRAGDISKTSASHIHGPHDGMVAAFGEATSAGYLELKLHDDKGDLELWLNQDDKHARPFDLPLDATIEIEFTDKSGRKVTLRPRNKTNNEDESGAANVRDGKTNYFIFPSQPGEDASWLQGKEFHSTVIVRFTRDGVAFASQKLGLAPHSH